MLTVCKSLLKSINAKKPAVIANGTRLITANTFPKKSPKKKTLLYISIISAHSLSSAIILVITEAASEGINKAAF